MRLRSADGTASFAVTPVGYQFPSDQEFSEDRNWLNVELDVALPDGRRWGVVDPCLLTSEAASMVAWLGAVVNGTQPVADDEADTWLTFTEPTFALAVAGYPDAHSVTMRVYLSYTGLNEDEDDDFYSPSVEITLTRAALAEEVAEWRGQVSSFPPR